MSDINIEVQCGKSKRLLTKSKLCNENIVVSAQKASLQSKTATPSSASQLITYDSGYDGLRGVTVNAVPTQTKGVTPTSSSQTIIPDSGKFLSSVTVDGDEHLVSENIRSGISIFGVLGALRGSSYKIGRSTVMGITIGLIEANGGIDIGDDLGHYQADMILAIEPDFHLTATWNPDAGCDYIDSSGHFVKTDCSVDDSYWYLDPNLMMFEAYKSVTLIYLKRPQMIEFWVSTRDGYGAWKAEEGMTWGEWCDSEYKDDRFHYNDNYVYYDSEDGGSCRIRISDTEAYCAPYDIIVASTGRYYAS